MHIGIHDIYFILALVATGALAGYTGGLFGVGGGAVLVPVLITIFPFFGASHAAVMHGAVGTSLALLVPNTFMSARKQYRMGNIEFPLVKRWLPFVVLGALIGVSIVKFIPTLYLKIFFALYLYVSFLFFLLKKELHEEIHGKPHGYAMGIVGSMIGCFSVLLGMGGGTFTVPYTQIHNYPIKKAVALSSTTGFFIGVVGTVGVIISGLGVPGRVPYSLGFVNLLAFIIMLPLVLVFPGYGVRTANHIDKKTLKRAYTIFLLVIALYMTSQIFVTY